MTASSASTPFDGELSDGQVGHALRAGSLTGIPAIYALVTLISLAAGAPLLDALVIAVWPAIVGGPFFGAVVFLGLAVAHDDRQAEVVPLPATNARRTPTASRAA
jgi:hypothetical protein